MQVGDLVKHSELYSLGVGLVTKNHGAHCMVQWTYGPDNDCLFPGPTLEAKSTLEIISEGR